MSIFKRQISKREAVLLAADRLRDSKTPSPEWIKTLLFIERNSPQWKRKRRRDSGELLSDLVAKIEQEKMRELTDAIEREELANTDSGGKLQ